MAIARDEIEKYIFDPENPKQCKSYTLLLRIAKRENVAFFSSYFLQYFLGQGLLDGKFKEELWDVPENYDALSFQEKIDVYISQLSEVDFEEYKNSLSENDLPFYNIMKYTFWKLFLKTNRRIYGNKWIYDFDFLDKNEFMTDTKEIIFENEASYNDYKNKYQVDSTNHHIFLIKSHFNILDSNILKSSVSISLEEDMEAYLEYENDNVKPIFLKKMEDVEILLNVLQKDIQQEKYASTEKEEIATIDSIRIENFFSIERMKFDNLKDKKEIYIVGENGDGKTLLLQAITIGLAGIEKGDVFDLVQTQDSAKIEILDSTKTTHTKDDSIYEYIFAYGASRYGNCQIKEDKTGYLTLFENKYDLKSPVNWLLSLDYNEKADKNNIVSVDEAKKLLNKLLNSDIQIDIIPPNQVTFSEKGSEVTFEQLSAGYKGVVTIICDLIDRLYEKQPYIEDIKDFRGIVLIDEVELHLHPKWKYDFMKKLRDTFPLIQFIVTTHSPTVILGSSKEAVFYKIYKDDGKVTISNQIANEGYTNNSLVSSPLFDMETITSREYDKTVSSDDYIYEKIHQQVAKKIKEDVNVNEAELLKLIDEELDKI